MKEGFKRLPKFTLGVEEEYQIIDPKTRDLRSHMSKIVEGGKIHLREQVKAEMHQSVVEVGTNVCENISQARREVSFLRSKIFELAQKQDLIVGAAGTHPFSKWVSGRPIKCTGDGAAFPRPAWYAELEQL